jgi:hypothetical protein
MREAVRPGKGNLEKAGYSIQTPLELERQSKVREVQFPILKNSRIVWLYKHNTFMIHMENFRDYSKHFCFMYVQAQHLDLDFYDHHFKPGLFDSPQRAHEKWH